MSDERDADLRDTHVSSEDQPRSPGAAATDEQTSPDGDVAKSARLAVQMLTQTASPSVVDGVAESLRAGLTSSISLPAFELTRGGARLGPDHYGAARMRELEKWSATVGDALVSRFASPVLPDVSLGLSNTALADTAQAVADRFADLLPTKVYSADWSEKYTNTLAPSRLWGGQHTEAFEATQRAAQSIARSLGPAPDWSERFAKALDTRYGAGWSPLAAWRPHSTALDTMLSTAVPADLPALGGLREPLELREALLRRAEPARTLEEAASLARVIDDPPLLADQLEAYRCGHVEGRNVSARRTEVATWITAGLTAVTAGLTAVLVHADPYVQKHLINDLHRWLQSLGG